LIPRLQQRGVLNVALPHDRPGLSQRDANGLWSGTAVDLVRAIAAELLGSAARVNFAAPADDLERRAALRGGHIDLALLDGDPSEADLAGDGDRSWTLPAAGPDGALSFLLPQQQTTFRHSVDRILQTPLQALRLGLTAENAPTTDTPQLSTAERRFLDLNAAPGSSDAGQGTPLQQGFVRRLLNRLGNAAQLWQRSHGGAAPSAASLDPAARPLDLPLDGPALQPAAATPRRDDALATLQQRGSLRVAVAAETSGQTRLSSSQQRLLDALAAALGNDAGPLRLELQTPRSPEESLGLLASGAVDLLLPDAYSTAWLDGVVGVDSVDGPEADPAVLLIRRASGISGWGDLGGSRLGLSGGNRVAAALEARLEQAGLRASLQPFSDSQAALRGLRLGQLDGVVLRRGITEEAQQQLEAYGIDTLLLPSPVLEGQAQWWLAADQSNLRDTLQALSLALAQARSLGLRRDGIASAYQQVLAGTASEGLLQVFAPAGQSSRAEALGADQIRRLLLAALD
ncbi:MAG: hypothetical protein VKK62_06650, partial [Synechococcaceae cyanobacterium]|nr:hypothetical protein [Synechococcaceae cyanobacterium]